MQSLWFVSGISLLTLVAVAGCGGDDDGGSPATGGRSGGAGTGGQLSTGGATTTGGSHTGGKSGSGGSHSGGSNTGGTPENTGGTGGASGDLPDSAVISDLTPDQFDQFCTEIDFSANEELLNDFVCRAVALSVAGQTATSDADAKTACQTFYNLCKQGAGTGTSTCKQPDSSCTATVGEARACYDDVPRLIDEATAMYPQCKDVTLADVENAQATAPMSDACTALQNDCPGLGPTSGLMP